MSATPQHDFTIQAHRKGWSLVDLADRWEVTPRQMSNIVRNPKQIHWDALIALPERVST